MGNLSLYKLSEQYNDVFSLLSDETLDIDALDDALDGIIESIHEKGINIASMTKNIDLTVGAIDETIKQLTARKKAIVNNQNRLKDYLLFNMQHTGITKIECPLFDIKLAKNPPSVEILDEDLIPADFKKEKITVSIDKTAIKKAGGCEGAKIIDDKQRLVIK